MKIIILGAGRLGLGLAQALLPAGHDITIIDNDADLIERLGSRMDILCINADAKQIDNLEKYGVSDSDVVIACTDNDDKNIVLASLAKELGVKKAYARVRRIEQPKQFDIIKRAMKLDYLLNPNLDCANEIFKILTNQYAIRDGYQIINGVALLQFPATVVPEMLDKQIMDCPNALDNHLIASISRKGKIIIPKGNTVIQPDDELYVIGSESDVRLLRDRLLTGHPGKDRISNVMIAGGGQTGLLLAKLLSASGVKVKLIENSKARAISDADELDNVSVIHGDAADRELLYEEDFDQMDAFVACTGSDEANFMLALFATQHGAKNVIARISQNNYGMVLNDMNNIVITNPVELCVARVLRSLKEDKNIVFSKLIQGQAEFIELHVDGKMPLKGKRLMDLDVPDGVIFAAVFREGELIVPKGSTVFREGDKLIVLSILSEIPKLQKLLKQYENEL